MLQGNVNILEGTLQYDSEFFGGGDTNYPNTTVTIASNAVFDVRSGFTIDKKIVIQPGGLIDKAANTPTITFLGNIEVQGKGMVNVIANNQGVEFAGPVIGAGDLMFYCDRAGPSGWLLSTHGGHRCICRSSRSRI